MTSDSNKHGANGCVCEGNWRALVAEYDPLIGRHYRDRKGTIYQFFGLVWGDNDFQFGLYSLDGRCRLMLLSCVGTLEAQGFVRAPELDA